MEFKFSKDNRDKVSGYINNYLIIMIMCGMKEWFKLKRV